MDQESLIRYIAGDATAEEKSSMAEWLDANPENMREFLAFRKLYDITLWQQENTDVQITNPSGSKKQYKFRTLAFDALKVAAIVAVAFIGARYLLPSDTTIEPIAMQTIHVPAGQRAELTLTDGTKVWLNAKTTFIFPNHFSANSRNVTLDGEGYFDVTSNKKQPFIVKTNHLSVKALGTTFNVQSYPSSDFTIATLEEGSVKVDIEKKFSPASILKPNEQLAYSHKTHQISINTVDAAKLSTWKEGYLLFRGAKFEEVVATLERKYNVQINYDAEKFNKQSYYVRFNPNETLEDALSVLSQITGKFKFSVHKSIVYIN